VIWVVCLRAAPPPGSRAGLALPHGLSHPPAAGASLHHLLRRPVLAVLRGQPVLADAVEHGVSLPAAAAPLRLPGRLRPPGASFPAGGGPGHRPRDPAHVGPVHGPRLQPDPRYLAGVAHFPYMARAAPGRDGAGLLPTRLGRGPPAPLVARAAP